MTLHVPTLRVGGSLSGELNAKNHCPCSVAVMTAPVELRVRLSRQVMFPVEDGIGNVYSIAYFFKEEVGLGKDAFRGDGGMAVASPRRSPWLVQIKNYVSRSLASCRRR